jgi:hypothetical protein
MLLSARLASSSPIALNRSGGRMPKHASSFFVPLVTLGGVALCAIPFLGGLVGLIAGAQVIAMTRREKQWALLHRGRLPVSAIASVVAGTRARLHGRVVSAAAVTAPVSERQVVYAAVTGKSSVRRGERERTLPARHLGEVIVIEDESGLAELTLRDAHLLSRHVAQHVEHDAGRRPALRELYRVPDDEHLEVEELSIEAGDELWIVGDVEGVADVPLEQPAGYRELAARRKVTLGPGAEGLRVTNLTPEELARVVASTPGYIAMGVIWLIASAGSFAFWGIRFFV